MDTYQFNIILISNDEKRIRNFEAILNDPQNKLTFYSFEQAFLQERLEKPFDLIVVDFVSQPSFDLSHILRVRNGLHLEQLPFIFVLNEDQQTTLKQLYKNPLNKILLEPLNKFIFISTLTSAIHLSNVERKLLLYQDIMEGEKKLISNMDELLGMDEVLAFENERDFLHHLESSFIRRLELALAVETAYFAYFDNEKNVLAFRIYDSSGKNLIRKHSFKLNKSLVNQLLIENYSLIFEKEKLLDPFVQELEEAIGVKIFSLLFIPIAVFHQPKGAILLINKLYRDAFTENDLSFSLIASQKIVYHLENLALDNLSALSGLDERFSIQEKQQLKLFQHIFQSVYFGILVFDEAYNIQFFNEASLTILGFDNNFKPKKLADLFNQNDYAYLIKNISSHNGAIVRQEIQLNRAKTPNFFIGYSVYPFTDNHQKRYIFVFSEISQTKRIQAEIIRMDRMASLGVLSSGIAHEIRNPLAGIKAMTQTLEEELDENSHQQEYVKRILRQVDRLDDLLKAFFKYARPSKPDPHEMAIEKIIDEVMPLVKPKMQHKRIKLVQDFQKGLLKVFVDANQIQQVFLNMLLNAIDAMPEGGTITIKARNAGQSKPILDRRNRLPGLLSDTFIEITVSDTGKGIPEFALEQVFNPFFTTKTNGTGLGLSIVYQIIREHGGRIDVRSQEGKGTEFTILLPALSQERG